MAVELKEEIRGEGTLPQTQPATSGLQPQTFSIQLNLSEDLQTTIVDVVLDDFDKMKGDRNKRDYGITSKGETLRFDEWFKRTKDLYNGNRIPKTIPWRFCSNRSLRIATAILDLIHARIFPAVWNEDLVRWKATKFVDVPKTERITKFMDWWVRVHNSMRPFYDIWVKYISGMGDALTETSWDVEEITTAETVQIPIEDEMGQPLVNQDGTPAVSEQPKVARIEKTKSKVITKDNVYMMENARDVQRDPIIIEETFLYKDLLNLEKQGVCTNISTKLKELIHVPEPGGNASPEEKARLRDIKLRNMPVKVAREYLHYDVEGGGFPESVRVMVSTEHRIYLGGVKMRDITKSGRRPLDFTKYDNYLDRPDDLDGEGVLQKVRELAEEVDACFNQLTDAHTLAVLRPFFYDPSGDVDAPALNLGPNKGIPVTDPQKNIYLPDFNIPTERLVNAIRLVMEFIERLTAASSYMMGKESDIVGGSGTATRTNAIMQSAEVRFSLPSERLRFGASRILMTHLDILQLNIPNGMEERVLGEKGEKIFHDGELTDDGIAGQFIAYILSDPSMGSKEQERQMMGMLYTMLLQNPVVASDPVKIYNVTSDTLKSFGRDDGYIQKWLGPPPVMDDITDPLDENTLMLQGDFKRVVPQITENHLEHIMKHMDLAKSPVLMELQQTAPELVMEIMNFNQQHIQQHMAMMQQLQSMMSSSQKGAPNGEGNGDPANAGTGGGVKTSGSQPGMENMSGPMAEANGAKRNGKVQAPQGV